MDKIWYNESELSSECPVIHHPKFGVVTWSKALRVFGCRLRILNKRKEVRERELLPTASQHHQQENPIRRCECQLPQWGRVVF